MWSIQTYIPKRGWRVSHLSESFLAFDVTPKIYGAGRRRVLQQKRKNVHAFLETDEIIFDWPDSNRLDIDGIINYDPYKSEYFMNEDQIFERGKILYFSDKVYIMSENNANIIQKKIEELQEKLKILQLECGHTEAIQKPGSNTGNYDPSADIYWIDFYCPDCLKKWSERQ